MASQPDKPDFSGTWKLNTGKSALQMPAPESALFEIDHREPRFRIKRTLVFEGKPDTLSFGLTTDGAESIQQFGGVQARIRLSWEGEDLLLDSMVRTPDDEGTNVVRYSLEDQGKTLVAIERLRSAKLRHDNRWVFDRQE